MATAAAVWLGAAAGAAQAPAPGIPAVSLTEPHYVQDTAEQHPLRVTVVARGLNHPFALALLPDGDALVSERGGALRLLRNAVGASGKPTVLEAAPVAGVPAIQTAFRNAGLHDLALHPRFAENRLVFFSFNLAGDALPPAAAGGAPRQQARLAIWRGRFDGRALTDVKQIWAGKSAATSGSRLTFGADGFLYVTIGAAFGTEAQELDNTVGKVLRLAEDGSIPSDNPFTKQAGAQGAIYSYGHRDPLGLAVHPLGGALLNVEHGPNGGDELNLIRAGRNYGWPRITFGRGYDGAELSASPVGTDIEPPLVVWLPSIAPTGLLVYSGDRFPAWKNNVFIGSARRGEIPGTGGLERLVLNDKLQELRRETLLTSLHLRIRDVRQGPDGLVYVVTDENDGAVLRLSPEPGG
ncbi:MAG: PQQ-dependent sugar dehydrogenase [Steroidobacteraceae bacterium]